MAETDELGLFETYSRVTRSARKKVNNAKQVERYVFCFASKKTAQYRDYFSPDSDAEKRMIGLKKTRTKKGKDEAGAEASSVLSVVRLSC